MVSIIILIFVAILAVALIWLAWGANARRRSGQSGPVHRGQDATPKVDRAPGPD